MTRNFEIDIFRLYLALLVLFFHGRDFISQLGWQYIPGFNGAIAVEGFFIISGFFFAKNIILAKKEIYEIIIRQLKKIYPYWFCACIIHFLFQIVSSFIHNQYLGLYLVESDFLLFNATGIPSHNLIIPGWYLSAYFIGLVFVYPFIKKWEETFNLIYAPIISLCLYGFFYKNYNEITFGCCLGDYFMNPLIICRAIAGILMGSFCFALTQKLISITFTKFGKFVLSFIKMSCLILSLYLTSSVVHSNSYYEMAVLWSWFNLFFIMLLPFNNSTVLQNIFVKYLSSNKLADFSLVLYINQYWVLYLIRHYMGINGGFLSYSIYIISSIIVTICAMIFVPKITKILKKLIVE